MIFFLSNFKLQTSNFQISVAGKALSFLLLILLGTFTPALAQRSAGPSRPVQAQKSAPARPATQPVASPQTVSEEEQQAAAIQQYLTALALAKSNLGAVYYVKVQLDSAEAHTRDALQIAPNFPVAHLTMGLIHYAKQRPQEAVAAFKASAEGDTIGQRRMSMVPPDTIFAWAKTQFNRLMQGPPSLPGAHTALAILYGQGGYLGDAERHFRQAIMTDSTYVDAYNNLGKLYADTQRFEEAVAIYDKALMLPLTEEQKPKVYLNLGVSYMGLNRSEEAIRAWRAAVDLKPDYAEAYLNLGIAYQSENLPDSARAAWTRAVAVKSDFVAARVALARLANDEGKFDDAETYYREILKLGAKDPRIYGELAVVYEQQEKFDLAIANYDEALKLDPDSSELSAGRAYVQQQIKTREEARKLRKIRLRQIVVRVKTEAEQLLVQLQGGADFVKMAQTKSIDASAADGGDLGYFGPGEMLPAFEAAAMKLKPGEVSSILETPMGYHILKRIE